MRHFLLLLLLSSGLFLCGKEIPFAENGKGKVSIVLTANASLPEKFAAEILQKYVERITGVKLLIGQAPAPGTIPFYIALPEDALLKSAPSAFREKLSGLKEDGFLIHSSQNAIYLTGKKKRSLIYGVSHLLQEYGKVIWFYPSPLKEALGEDCPKAPYFRIPAGIILKNPCFAERRYWASGPGVNDWLILNGQQVYAMGPYGWSLPGFYRCDPIFTRGGHDMTSLLVGPDDNKRTNYYKLFAEHPEYFGLRDGKRVDSGNMPWKKKQVISQPCTSNVEVLKRMAANALRSVEIFKGKGDVFRDFSNDDHTRWCQCENCRKLDLPLDKTGNNREGNRWWHFINYMANEFFKADPKSVVHTLVYQTYRYPPTGIKPDPRVIVTICPHHRCYIHALQDPKCSMNHNFRRMFEAWKQAGMRGTTFEYFNQMSGVTTYLPMEKAWIRDLKFYHSLGMYGYGFAARAPFHFPPWLKKRTRAELQKPPLDGGSWVARWQHHWLNAYFSWNINADYDKVYEYINSRYYGKGWKYMKPYRAELIKALYEADIHIGYEFPDRVLGKCFERPGFPGNLYELLDKAEKLVKDDPIRRERIQRERAMFKANWESAYKEFLAARPSKYHAGERKGPIRIDGELNEADWKNGADFITSFGVFMKENVKADPQTFVRCLYDGSNLYFGVNAVRKKGEKLPSPAKDGAKNPFRGSHLEFFISHPALRGAYYHLVIGRNGTTYQAMTRSAGARDQSYKLDVEFKIRDLEKEWVAEVRIPVNKWGIKLQNGMEFRVNFGRAAWKNGKLEQSSSANGVFHGDANLYNALVLGKAGAIIKNGDFEEVDPKWKRPANSRHPWEFTQGKRPLHWYYNENTPAVATVVEKDPVSGKYALALQEKGKGFVMLGQFFHKKFPADIKKVNAALYVKGKGKAIIYLSGKQAPGKKTRMTIAFDSPQKWQLLQGVLDVPEKPSSFWIRLDGKEAFLIDNFSLTPADMQEEMPSMESVEKKMLESAKSKK